jgi:hypothetical protein
VTSAVSFRAVVHLKRANSGIVLIKRGQSENYSSEMWGLGNLAVHKSREHYNNVDLSFGSLIDED